MPYKRVWEIPSAKIPAPKERALQIVMSPQVDKGMQNCTLLTSIIAPRTGKTGVHTHPVDEYIYIITGRGEGEESGKTFKIEPGTLIYAPAGVEHDCRNLGDDTMVLFCIYVPALPDDVVEGIIKKSN